MKYFTLDWYDADHTDDEFRSLFGAFHEQVQAMRGTFPEDVVALQELPGVDDGLIVRVLRDRERLTLILRCGDLRIGYYDLVIHYEGASLTPVDERTLARVARTTKGNRTLVYDVAYHELGRSDGGKLEHGFLFHPGVCFTIRCDALRWQRIDRPNRRLPHYRDRYPGGPELSPEELNPPELCELRAYTRWARG